MGVRDPHDPDENIDAGASHLRAMLDTFKGDLPLALAAYNAGEKHVVRHRGIPPFPETRQFVARVLRRMGDKQGAETVLAKPVPAPAVDRAQPALAVEGSHGERPAQVPDPHATDHAPGRQPPGRGAGGRSARAARAGAAAQLAHLVADAGDHCAVDARRRCPTPPSRSAPVPP